MYMCTYTHIYTYDTYVCMYVYVHVCTRTYTHKAAVLQFLYHILQFPHLSYHKNDQS